MAVVVTPITDSATGAGNINNPILMGTMNTGTAAADRITVVAIGYTNRAFATSLLVGAISATLGKAQNNGTGTTSGEIWYCANPTGTSADIQMTFPGTQGSAFAATIFSVTGATLAPSDTDGAGTTGVNSISISGLTIPTNGGAVLLGICGDQASAVTWTNATEYNDDNRLDFRNSAAYTLTAGTPTITFNGGDGSSHVLMGLAWSPAGAAAAFPENYYTQQRAA